MWKDFVYILCGVVLVSNTNARLCERMTSCDLFRFLRTHKKQISSVDEKTVRVDFLTLNLYNEGVDLRQKIDLLEHELKGVTQKRNSLMDLATDEHEFEHMVHHDANQHLHQLIVVLRKWLTDVKETLNVTLRDAEIQQEDIQRLNDEIRDSHHRVRAVKHIVVSQQKGKNKTAPEFDNCLFCNGDSKRRYPVLDADKGIRLASTEMKNIKVSLSTIKLLVNQTEENCFHRLSKLATRIEFLNMKLKSLESAWWLPLKRNI